MIHTTDIKSRKHQTINNSRKREKPLERIVDEGSAENLLPRAKVNNVLNGSENSVPYKKIANHKIEKLEVKKPKKVEQANEKGEATANLLPSKLLAAVSHSESESASESEKEPNYKTRLFVGEAGFHYTRAVIQKHKDNNPNSTLAHSIIATAYESKKDLRFTYTDFEDNRAYILGANGSLLYNVDATSLHTDKRLIDRRIKRIHFNFPHDKSDFKNQTLPTLIKGFFKSANNIQKSGDRVHIALPAPVAPDSRKFREGYVYHIYDASRQAGYNLIKKKLFSVERYPGYQHMETGVNTSAPIAQRAREYIFEKLPANTSKNAFKKPIQYYAYGANYNCLPEIKTDSESSSYEDHSSSDSDHKGNDSSPVS